VSGMPRRAVLLAGLVLAFLALGAPRWLDDGAAPGTEGVAGVCRAHGGTPARTEGSPACTVRYGDRVYVMDAVTAAGFDEDAARFNRRGCEEARRGPDGGPRFVFHEDSGVCENGA
jgi:hypothetical protein